MKRHGRPHGKLSSTLVLMSSSLSPGCGGKTLGAGESGGGGASGGGDASGGGTFGDEGSGGSPAAGATGGAIAAGGTGGAPSAAAGSGGGIWGTTPPAVEPGPFDCPPEQLECSTSWTCFYERLYESPRSEGFVLPAGCSCNEERPVAPEDCGEGEKLFCVHAVANEEGQRFTKDVAIQCQCRPYTEGEDCDFHCNELTGAGFSHCYLSGETDLLDDLWSAVLCSCAVTILR